MQAPHSLEKVSKRTNQLVGPRFKENDRVIRRTTAVSARYDTSIGTVLGKVEKKNKVGRVHWSYRVLFDNSKKEIIISQCRLREITPDDTDSAPSSI